MERLTEHTPIPVVCCITNWKTEGVQAALRLAEQMHIEFRLGENNNGGEDLPVLTLLLTQRRDLYDFWITLQDKVPYYWDKRRGV